MTTPTLTLPDDWDWQNPEYDGVWQTRAHRLNHMRKHPEIVTKLWDFYAGNPAHFIHDWGVTFDPRLAERGINPVVPFLLFPRQHEFIDWVVQRWKARENGVVEKSRDMGVSWLCVGVAAWMLLFVYGSVVGMGSRKEEYVDKIGDPKSLFWKIRMFINMLPVEFQPKRWDESKHAPHMRVTNPGLSSFITGEAGDNVGRGNRTALYLVDEFAFFERPEQVDASLSQTTNCRIDVSTPNGAGNPFYRRAHDGKTPKFVFDWRDDPRKDEAWYADQKSKLDPVVLAQEVDRDYTASVANAFITGNVVTMASRSGAGDMMAYGPIMVGVDVARFGNDKSVITIRRGRVVSQQHVYGKLDVVDCAGMVKKHVLALLEKPAQIAVDTIGIGSGVADILRRDFGDIVVDVNSALRLDDGEHYNLRARMWSDMREWLKSGASIPNDPDLVSDLTALQYHYKGGLLLMESKEDAKKRGIKSPDRADSLALTFAVPPKKADDEFDMPASDLMKWGVLDSVIGY